jgi:uncharacterized protein (TIGR03067 family)
MLIVLGLFAFLALGLFWQRQTARRDTVALMPPLPLAAPAPVQDDGWTEHRALEHAWVATDMLVDGDKPTDTAVADVHLELFGKHFLLALPRGKYEGEWFGDLDTKPRQLDFVPDDGRRNLQAIYRIDGDTMKLCFAPDDKPRPSDFTAEKGSGRTLLVLKRKP